MAATLVADERVERYAMQAHAASMARDQLERFVKAGYIALPSMLAFHVAARECDRYGGPEEIGLGGTRGPGKSHAVLAQVMDDCQRVSGLKFLYLRKVMKSAAESFEDLVLKVLRYTDHEYTAGKVTFPNGSRILIGGFHDESDIDKYLGIEYDGLVIEEATQISERKKQMIYGSIRSSVPGWRPRKYHTTNPDGVGLPWFKRTFIIPWRKGEQAFTRFFQGNYKDNPFLDEGYIRYLEGLTGPLGKAWRDGDWDAFEGMAFPNWSYQRHVCKPFEIPEGWTRWRGLDWGYSNPFACVWVARDPDSRRMYVYREAYDTLLTDVQQAQKLKDMTPPAEVINVTYADPSMWGRKVAGDLVTTTASTYGAQGVPLTKADNDRLQGKRKVDQALADLPDGEPGLKVFSTCANFIETVPLLVFDKIHTEDVDTEQDDHLYDALRYALTNITTQPANQRRPIERPPMARIRSL